MNQNDVKVSFYLKTNETNADTYSLAVPETRASIVPSPPLTTGSNTILQSGKMLFMPSP